MEKQTFARRILATNTFVIISVFFTAAMVVNLAASFFISDVEITEGIVISRLLVSIFAGGSLWLYKRFDNPFAALAVHIISLLVFSVVQWWITGSLLSLHEYSIWSGLPHVLIGYGAAAVLVVFGMLMAKRRNG
ncbi:MAG: hypothetical protein FWE21_03195 [Defluviitaleaceae bacterium]|nr:hypothetical protein [Defluviitaleaceae bacterium]